jgi:putative tricarboxylic transport membrane protein
MERAFRALVAGIFLLLSAAYGIGALMLPMGTVEQPGPGFFPLMIALTMAGLSSWLLGHGLSRMAPETRGEGLFPRGADLRRVLALGGGLILFAMFLHPLGYGIAATGLMTMVLSLLGMRSWSRILMAAVLTSGVSYCLFGVLLDVPLPPGALFD